MVSVLYRPAVLEWPSALAMPSPGLSGQEVLGVPSRRIADGGDGIQIGPGVASGGPDGIAGDSAGAIVDLPAREMDTLGLATRLNDLSMRLDLVTRQLETLVAEAGQRPVAAPEDSDGRSSLTADGSPDPVVPVAAASEDQAVDVVVDRPFQAVDKEHPDLVAWDQDGSAEAAAIADGRDDSVSWNEARLAVATSDGPLDDATQDPPADAMDDPEASTPQGFDEASSDATQQASAPLGESGLAVDRSGRDSAALARLQRLAAVLEEEIMGLAQATATEGAVSRADEQTADTARPGEDPGVFEQGVVTPEDEWFINLIAVRRESAAVDLQRAYRDKGVDTRVVAIGNGDLWGVRVGGFGSRQQAVDRSTDIKSALGIDEVWITRQ
ncbi:SPOR domain-containing protein [Thioalkalicoccus limnaeus]|uniref:SPOR domain-containing protein n=1 Tax=Thioalkalicoccus limnaeus TaxID=120681 RepID=A0ABV4BCN4_9GAMM